MALVFACNFGKKKKVQNYYFKNIYFFKNDQTLGRHEKLAFLVKVAMKLFQVSL